MITYLEFKEMFCRIMGKRDVGEDNADMVFKFQRRILSANEENEKEFIVSNDELLDLYNQVTTISYNRLEIFKRDYYEVAIDFDYPMIRNRDITSNSDDTINGIHYELSAPSVIYSAFLLLMFGEEYYSNQRRRPFPIKFRRFQDLSRYEDEEIAITLQNILPKIIGELSLKIRTTSQESLERFRILKSSYAFEFMYLSDMALVDFNDINDIFKMPNLIRNRFDITQLNVPPLREYAVDVIDYYKLALSTSDPYIKFISFYHVMEYFYDEVFKKKMVDDLKNKITHPDFSYKNDDKIYDIALFIKNRMRINVEAGQGNELESLNFVLCEYIVIDDLKIRINNIDTQAIQYYQTTKVPFSNAPTISWNDVNGVVTMISKRIYFTRNSLIHSKSGKNDERYRPYVNEPQLQKEIPLVKAIAELIIINSSKIL